MPAHILYVEDDETLGFVTRDNLEINGFKVTHITDGREAMNILSTLQFDLAILDVMLPHIDGYELGRAIRQQNADVPILYLTAKSLKDDRLTGFSLGADDYITKPFSIEELVFRIHVFLKRSKSGTAEVTGGRVNLGQYTFEYANLVLASDGEKRLLTQKEGDLLNYLILHKNRLCKRSEILEKIWGEDDYFMGRSLDVFISRLRKYLASDPSINLENIHSVGFKLKADE
ncbi:MAG: response regulator transcription factor [Saprospiraceae bacterium]|nr:response regulator transcription factor [Saprospiraceae bacterium]